MKKIQIFKQIEDGKWHIDFYKWTMNAISKVMMWGMIPFVVYIELSRDFNMTNPLPFELIATYLILQLIVTIVNPPKYMMEKPVDSNNQTVKKAQE